MQIWLLHHLSIIDHSKDVSFPMEINLREIQMVNHDGLSNRRLQEMVMEEEKIASTSA